MKKKNNCWNAHDAVSPVVGEMLVLTMVLILAAVFSSSLSGFIPDDRPESVNLAIYGIYNVSKDINVTIWHKGGDPLPLSDIRVIFSDSDTYAVVNYHTNMTVNDDPDISVFLPGDFMVVDPGNDVKGCNVRIATSDAVIFTGKVK